MIKVKAENRERKKKLLKAIEDIKKLHAKVPLRKLTAGDIHKISEQESATKKLDTSLLTPSTTEGVMTKSEWKDYTSFK